MQLLKQLTTAMLAQTEIILIDINDPLTSNGQRRNMLGHYWNLRLNANKIFSSL